MPSHRKRIYSDLSDLTSPTEASSNIPIDDTHASLKESLKTKLYKRSHNGSASNNHYRFTEKIIQDCDTVISVHKEALELLDIRLCDYTSGREKEIESLQNKIENLLKKRTGGFIHISGSSGVGKTCVVKHVSNLLCKRSDYKSILSDQAIEIKCALQGNKILDNFSEFLNFSKTHKKSQHKSFKEQSEHLKYIFREQEKLKICILDELDFLNSSGTKRLDIVGRKNNKQTDLIKTILEASTQIESKIIILGISNSVNLIDFKSLKGNCIIFPPYNEQQLSDIISQKLSPLGTKLSLIFEQNSHQLINRKVSNHNGDFRTCLSTFRKAIESSFSTLIEQKKKHESRLHNFSITNTISHIDQDSWGHNICNLKVQSSKEIKQHSLNETYSMCNSENSGLYSQETTASDNDLLNRSDHYLSGSSRGYNSYCSQASDNTSITDSLDRNTISDFPQIENIYCTCEQTDPLLGSAITSSPLRKEKVHSPKDSDNNSRLSISVDSDELHPRGKKKPSSLPRDDGLSPRCLSPVENFEIPTRSSKHFLEKGSQYYSHSRKFGTELLLDSSSSQHLNRNRFDEVSNLDSEAENENPLKILFLKQNLDYSVIGAASLNRLINPHINQNKENLIVKIRSLPIMKRIYLRSLFQAAIESSKSEETFAIKKTYDSLSTDIEIPIEDVYNCYRTLPYFKGGSIPIMRMEGSSFQQALEEFEHAGFCRMKKVDPRAQKGKSLASNGLQINNMKCFTPNRGRIIELSLCISLIESLIAILDSDLHDVNLRQHFDYGHEN